MNTIYVDELGITKHDDSYVLNLASTKVRDCCGCWTCWWKTPGRCIFTDLNEFFHQYVTSDKAIFFSNVSMGFVSGNMKSLFDRMISLYMPYTTINTGESMHVTRYDHYPDIEFYYDGDFITEDGKQVYEEYIHRVFYQFHSKNIVIKPISEYQEGGSIH